MKLIIVTAVCFVALGVQAQAHKCIGPGGKIEYSDTACPTDAKGTTVRTDRPNSIDSSSGHAQVRRDTEDLAAANAYNRCVSAKASVQHANTLDDYRGRKASARKECGEPPPSPEEVAKRRERILRRAQIDATNRNTAAVESSAAGARATALSGDSKKLELTCKPGFLSGTANCKER